MKWTIHLVPLGSAWLTFQDKYPITTPECFKDLLQALERETSAGWEKERILEELDNIANPAEGSGKS
jgi:hypothetical protein